MLVGAIKDQGVNIEVKYKTLHLIKDLMQPAKPVTGQVFAEKYLASVTDIVLEEIQREGKGETLFGHLKDPDGDLSCN